MTIKASLVLCLLACSANCDAGMESTTPSPAGTSECGTCASDQLCVRWQNVGLRCSSKCTNDGQCASGCCATLTRDNFTTEACAPDTSWCRSDATCFPLFPGGPCVPPTPSSCPGGEVVCNCPETHGAWCHDPCAFDFCSGARNECAH